MCGRYASARSVDDIAGVFGVGADDIEQLPPADWNVAPTKDVRAVVVADSRPTLTTLRWGLVPAWANDPAMGSRLIIARVETVHERSAFRDVLTRRRCLLPADGWYEWATAGGMRQPYFLTMPDAPVLALAGIWDSWSGPDGDLLRTVAILTTAAAAELAWLHDRSPLVLDPAEWARWLDPTTSDIDDLLHTPAPAAMATPVDPRVGDVRANGPQLIEPVQLDEQPSLF